MKTWHSTDQQNRPKQVSEEAIGPLVNSSEIVPQTRLWTECMQDWVPAGDLMLQLSQNKPRAAPTPPLPPGEGSVLGGLGNLLDGDS